MSPLSLRTDLGAWCLAVTLTGALTGPPGCARFDTRVVPLGPSWPAGRADSPVRIYRAPLPPMDAQEVGLIEVTTYTTDEDVTLLLEAMQSRARALGANAVAWLREDRAPGFLRVVGSALRVHTPMGTPPPAVTTPPAPVP